MLRALALLLFVLFSPQLYSQQRESDPKFSNASVAESKTRVTKIQRELRHLGDHAWAGQYYYGDGLGVNVNLTLAPDNGFVFTWHGCLGLYDVNYGDVAFTNGTVKLLFKYPNSQEGFQGIAPELLPVRWGQRHYLIPVDGVVEFANAVNSGIEAGGLIGGRSGRFLLRNGDEKKPLEGVPDLPGDYSSYLLSEPIQAKVTAVGESTVRRIDKDLSSRATYIVLNVGAADGLKEGMELSVTSPRGIIDTAVVKSVSEHSATAMIKQLGVSSPVPSMGWELSTKFQ